MKERVGDTFGCLILLNFDGRVLETYDEILYNGGRTIE